MKEQKIVIPGRVDKDLSSVSNIPLTCPSTPGVLREIKGCQFVPPVFLNRDTLYFVVVTNRLSYMPQSGWYDVPDKGYLTWIKAFQLLQVSYVSIAGSHARIYKAIEGEPPVECVLKGGKG